MKKPKLIVQKRKTLGRPVKKLRREGVLPANLYGKKVKSQALQVDLKDFEKIYRQTGETGIINLKIKSETKTRPVLIHNLQLDPVTDLPLHADFHQISLKEKTTVEIPVELLGEAPAEKEGVGILVTLLDSLEVEALPGDLPEKLQVDISHLKEVDDAVKVADLKVDEKKVKILANANELVAKIEAPTEEEAPPEEAVAEEEAPPEEAAEEVKAEKGKPEEKPKAKEAEPEEKKEKKPEEPKAAKEEKLSEKKTK